MKKSIRFGLYALLIFISLTLLFQMFSDFRMNPTENIAVIYPSYHVSDAGGQYVIDDSNKRVLGTNNGKVEFVLHGGKRGTGNFYFASELLPVNDRIYVMSYTWDPSGSYIEYESILAYDRSGAYLDTPYLTVHDRDDILVPTLMGLTWSDETLSFFQAIDDNIIYFKSPSGGSAEQVRDIVVPDSSFLVQDITLYKDGTYAVTTRDGYIQQISNDGTVEVIFDGSDMELDEKFILPWSAEYSEDGYVYFTNLGDGSVRRVDAEGHSEIIMTHEILKESGIDDREETYYNISLSLDGYVGISNFFEVIEIIPDGDGYRFTSAEDYQPSGKVGISAWLNWIAIVVLVTVAAVTVVDIYLNVMNRKIPEILPKVAAIVVIIALTAYLVGNMSINNFYNLYSDEVSRNLKLSSQNLSKVIDGDAVAKIQSPRDYLGEDYNLVFEQLNEVLNYNSDIWNENLYTALYRIEDERVFGLMYNDGAMTPYYPFDAYTTDPDYDFFKIANEGGISSDTEIDNDGEWLFSMSPVYDSSGEVVGVFEVGTNLFIFQEKTAEVIRNLLIDLLTLVIVIALMSVEFAFLNQLIIDRRAREEIAPHGKYLDDTDIPMIRPLSFLIFITVYMALAFIPLLAKDLARPILGLDQSMVIGLPISAEVLASGVTMLFAGYFAQSNGWRRTFTIGAIIVIVAAVLTTMSQDILYFIGMRTLSGIGTGFMFMALRGYVNIGSTTSTRNDGFAQLTAGAVAGMNVGVVMGANLADKIGMLSVFYVMAIFGVISFVFVMLQMRVPENRGARHEKEESSISVLKFYLNPKVLLFFIAILIPAYIAGMYLEYFFPVYAEEQGLSTSVIGLAFTLYGLIIVYLGPTFAQLGERKLGIRSAAALASLLTGLSLLTFAMTGNLTGALVAVVILGLSDGFGEAAYNSYFLELEAAQAMGESSASGHFEFVGNIGKMIGPVVIAIMLGMGAEKGIGLIAVGVLILMAVFLLFSGIGNKKGSVDSQTND